MERSLLIIGSGGHARSVLDCALELGAWEFITFMTSDPDHPGEIAGFPVVQEGFYEPSEAARMFDIVIAVGDGAEREKLFHLYENAGASLPMLVHPRASVSRLAHVDSGSVVMAQAVVNSFAYVGRGCIVNTGAVVEHECRVGDFSHLSPGARMDGGSSIGAKCWLCLGSSVCDHVSLCDGVMLGANGFLRSDVRQPGTYVGLPAHLISGSGLSKAVAGGEDVLNIEGQMSGGCGPSLISGFTYVPGGKVA